MSMLKYRYGELYIRRLRKGDKCTSILDAFALAALKLTAERTGRLPYVAVRRGFPGEILASSLSRRDLMERLTHGRSWNSTRKFFRCAYPSKP